MIYLDYAATTPIDSDILEYIKDIAISNFANTTSLHLLGQKNNYLYEKYSEDIKETLNIKDFDVIYTSNATIANNLAILGILNKYKSGNIITTSFEHPSVKEVIASKKDSFDICYLNTLEDGRCDIEELRSKINKDTVLVSIMWVNNVTGVIQDIKEAINIVKKYPRCKLHIDATQGMCKVLPNFDLSNVDLFTFSVHKIYGPKGVGCLLKKKNLELEKIVYGSSSQKGLYPGTFSLALVAATAKALKKGMDSVKENSIKAKELFMYLYEEFSKIDGVSINSPSKYNCYYIFNFSYKNTKAETMVHYLESKDIYVSTGSSCSSKLKKKDDAIYALTKDIDRSENAIRISIGKNTSIEELKELVKAIKEYGDRYV